MAKSEKCSTVKGTQAAELKHAFNVKSLVSESLPQTSIHPMVQFDVENHSKPTVLSMSIWKGMKFLKFSSIVVQIAESILALVKYEGKSLIRSSNAILKAERCVIDESFKADTVVCTCGHQCLNHAKTTNLYCCLVCSSPVTAFVRKDGMII